MKKVKLQIEYLPIDALQPYSRNTRKHTKEDIDIIAKSIEKYSMSDPIGIWSDHNVVVEGHGRLEACKKLGYTEVPVIRLDHLTDEERREYGILHNWTAEQSDWDFDELKTEIEDLDFNGFDLGFEFDEEKEVKEDDFDVEAELEKPTFSRAGDLWLLGKHRAFCGDSTLSESYATLMEGQEANLVLTDPPYNVNVEETAGKIMNDNMGDSEFYTFLFSAFTQMHDNLAKDGSIYIFHADTEGLNFRKAFKEAGFYLSGCCIWKKNSLVLGRSPYQWIHEPCLYGWRVDGKHQWYGDRKQTTVWEYDKPRKNGEHPTMKPIPLLSYPINNSTMTNAIVLDPFLGSGSTLIACEETGRICRGIELDTKFMDVIVKRYIEHNSGSTSDVFVIRDGKKIPYDEVEKPE